MKTKRATRKRWPPGKELPKLAAVAEEERFWLAHDFDEAMEVGGEPVRTESGSGPPLSGLQALAKRRGVNASK